MPDEVEENFCKKMANATKLIHHRSDGLVKSKLLFGKGHRTPQGSLKKDLYWRFYLSLDIAHLIMYLSTKIFFMKHQKTMSFVLYSSFFIGFLFW